MPKKSKSKEHPIKRVRREFKKLPQISGMSRLSGAKQFAHWVGCSESLIRNVETGAADFSEKLAKMIEAKTSVSADWLLSEPGLEEPIRDISGQEWSLKRLDIFATFPDLGLLYRICPSLLPRVIAKLVEAELRLNFFNGERDYSTSLLQRLHRKGSFMDNEFRHCLSSAIMEDEAFKGKYLDCLDRALDDFSKESPKREQDLHLLKELEPPPQPGSRISKLADERRVPVD